MEPLQGFPNCHTGCVTPCFTETSSSLHNGIGRRNSRKLHSIPQAGKTKVLHLVPGFMADEAGGLQEGLKGIYGSSVLKKSKTCELHCLQCANRQRACLHSQKSREFFTCVTRTLLIK